MHRPTQLQRQIEQIKQMLLKLGAQVEEDMDLSIQAFLNRDPKLIDHVRKYENEVNAMELRIEEQLIHTLALNQPVAFDLRYIVGVFRINKNLERVGDLALHIAKEAGRNLQHPPLQGIPFDLDQMSIKSRSMFKRSIDAFSHVDVQLAQSVIETFDQLHWMRFELDRSAGDTIRDNPTRIKQMIHAINTGSHLARIGYISVDIAKEVIYIVTGETPWSQKDKIA